MIEFLINIQLVSVGVSLTLNCWKIREIEVGEVSLNIELVSVGVSLTFN